MVVHGRVGDQLPHPGRAGAGDQQLQHRAPDAAHRYVLETVRAADRERFLGALFAPEPARSDLLALLAFDHELARTRTVTREPMLARIRLQWWREAVAEAAAAEPPSQTPYYPPKLGKDVGTAITAEVMEAVARAHVSFPVGFTVHPKELPQL